MTLIELVVAISVMVLVSTLCFSKDDNNKHQINSFAKQLCSDIRYVRKCNMLGDLNTYIYYKKDNDKTSYILRSDFKDVKEIDLPNGSKLIGLSKILFNTNGSPNPKGQTIEIISNSIQKQITIVPVSGRVLLKEGKYET
ncbi:MAG: pilus assembly FimT family protein [Romboutsia sp.]|uniref:pilus assembly FimT family protein n=1 Tax=Romboutsia sp. TaxID=1965302 RepID=UPI003F3FA06F